MSSLAVVCKAMPLRYRLQPSLTADGINPPSDNTIKLVEMRAFYKNFIGGDWRFKSFVRVNDTN